MVEILEREAGGIVGRRTADVDVLVDVRSATTALRDATQRLESADFNAELTVDGLSYRFRRGDDVVDLLAPDHLGERADLTTSPPGVTLEVTGGTQALSRRRQVQIEVNGRVFQLPVPTLAGAIVIKTRAAKSGYTAKQRERHQRDLARLLVSIRDIDGVRAEMTSRERVKLRRLRSLFDRNDAAWRGIANSADGLIALERITS